MASSCANIVMPTGGPRDTMPPKIVAEKSTPNFQTRFQKQRIILSFDEWIKLEDAFNQVVVSPPLNKRPEVSLHGKSVWIDFDKNEILKENATYTINFGNAVKDLNESNPAKDLRFVFSTGAVIDSLSVIGEVVDALNGQPVEGALLMLYDNLADSVVRTSKPFYFGRTNKQGLTTIENVREGVFKVFALADKDLNYTFNQDIENIGFLDSFLTVNKDFLPLKIDTTGIKNTDSLRQTALGKSPNKVKIQLFSPEKQQKIVSKELDKYGQIRLLYSKSPETVRLSWDSIGQAIKTDKIRDSLLIFYDIKDATTWNLYARNDSGKTDTLRIRPKGRADFLAKNKLSALNLGTIGSKKPNQDFYIDFNFPIENIDTQGISLIDTSGAKALPLSIGLDIRRLVLKAPFEEGHVYDLVIRPKTLVGWAGLSHDTIKSRIVALPKKEFGDILLKINGLDTNKHYLYQLVSNSGVIVHSQTISKTSAVEKRFDTLIPDQYSLVVVEDRNANGRWDTGDYDKKQQPERLVTKKADSALRANWELEIILDWSND